MTCARTLRCFVIEDAVGGRKSGKTCVGCWGRPIKVATGTRRGRAVAPEERLLLREEGLLLKKGCS